MKPDHDNNTPARIAALEGHAELAQYLRDVERALGIIID
jgi:hypothetical protein